MLGEKELGVAETTGCGGTGGCNTCGACCGACSFISDNCFSFPCNHDVLSFGLNKK